MRVEDENMARRSTLRLGVSAMRLRRSLRSTASGLLAAPSPPLRSSACLTLNVTEFVERRSSFANLSPKESARARLLEHDLARAARAASGSMPTSP